MRSSGMSPYWSVLLLLTPTAHAMPGMGMAGFSSATLSLHGRQDWPVPSRAAGAALGRDACQGFRSEHGAVCRRMAPDRRPHPEGDAGPGCRGCHGGLVDKERISLRYASYVPGRDTGPRHCDTCHGGSQAAYADPRRTSLDSPSPTWAGNYLPIAKPYGQSAGRVTDCKDCHIGPRGD